MCGPLLVGVILYKDNDIAGHYQKIILRNILSLSFAHSHPHSMLRLRCLTDTSTENKKYPHTPFLIHHPQSYSRNTLSLPVLVRNGMGSLSADCMIYPALSTAAVLDVVVFIESSQRRVPFLDSYMQTRGE